MKRTKKRYLVASLSLAFLFFSPVLAQEMSDYDQLKQEIIMISNIDSEDLENSILSISIQSGLTKEEVAQVLLDDMMNEEVTSGESVGEERAASVKLAHSTKGDIWFSEATTSLYRHGHVGLYQSSSVIIEARGNGYKVAPRKTSDITAKSGDMILGVSSAANGRTRISSKVRDEAVNFANSKQGREYARTLDNKKCGNHDYNCSQLVWCAFKQSSASLDLDSDGTWFVSPSDIKNSNRTFVIRRY